MSDRYVEPEFRMGWWMPAEWPRHRVWSDMLYCPFCGAGVREGRKGKHMLKAHREIHQKIIDRCNKLNLEVLNSKGVAWTACHPSRPRQQKPYTFVNYVLCFVNNLLSLPWYSHMWPPGVPDINSSIVFNFRSIQVGMIIWRYTHAVAKYVPGKTQLFYLALFSWRISVVDARLIKKRSCWALYTC